MNHNITKTNAQPVRNDDFYQIPWFSCVFGVALFPFIHVEQTPTHFVDDCCCSYVIFQRLIISICLYVSIFFN